MKKRPLDTQKRKFNEKLKKNSFRAVSGLPPAFASRMDEFSSIDWNPPLEDMLEGDFVDVQRLQKESAMYKALRGNLCDPFLDLHEDFEHLATKELISQIELESREKREAAKDGLARREQPSEAPRPEMSYVPGIMKSTLKFPRPSELNAQQQALSLQVLLRYSGSEKPSLSAANKEELQTYMNLLPVISKEQDAFMEFVKSNWDPSAFTVQEEEFVNFHWKRRVELVNSLPRYYVEAENIPFVSSKEIGLNFHSTCLEMGTVPKILLPKLTRRVSMPPHTTKMNQRFFFVDRNEETHKSVVFKTPVSQDPNCDTLAKLHEVDLVISSSGLNCLALNIDPNMVASWTLPVVVKRVDAKNVVFVDKALPPTGLTVLQKNAWMHKYNVKSHLSHPYHSGAVRLDEDPDRPKEEPDDCAQNDETDATESAKKDTNEAAEDKKNPNFVPPPTGHNLFYRLFSVGSSDESQNELMKNRVEKVYKLLVRTKTDGLLKASTGEEYLTMIAAKVEHQLALGAEAVSVEESAKQWMSLTFRPDTSLIRVRLEATSTEFIQYEKRTAMSINNEIKRLYGLKTEAALTLLYNVTETMTGMNPGRYIMRHTPRNGAFACVYKDADGPGKNVFDLQTIYWSSECPTIPNPPWPPLDKVVVTPALKVFKRMPAMFYPPRKSDGRNTAGHKNQRGGKSGRGGRRGRPKKTAARGRQTENPVPE